MTPSFVSSGADLVSMAPADLFADVTSSALPDSTGDADLGDTAFSDDGDAEAIPDMPESEEGSEPDVADDEGGDPEPPVVAAAAQKGDLPEGVSKGKDRNGKQGLFVTPERWDRIYPDHQLVQQVSEIIGEPASVEQLKLGHDAYILQENLYTALTSANPESQAAVLNDFYNEMAREVSEGGVASDPAVPFAESFYSTTKERSPAAFAALRMSAARDFVGEIFREAAESGDTALFQSGQHIARMLAGMGKDVTDPAKVRSVADRMKIPFYTHAEMGGLKQGTDPMAQLRAENQRLQEQISGRTTNTQAAQFGEWSNRTNSAIASSVLADAVTPALATVAESWKNSPADYQRLVIGPLHSEVDAALKTDPVLAQKISILKTQASRAASAQKRDEIGQQIVQAYVNRAKQIADVKRKPILEFAATWKADRSSQTHKRLSAAQNQSAPKGAAGAVPRSILGSADTVVKGGSFDAKSAAQEARRLIFGGA